MDNVGKQAEERLIENVDGDHVIAAAMALEVPVSALLPVKKPASPEEVGPTTREQLLALGMSEEEVRAFGNGLDLDLDGHGAVIACFGDGSEGDDGDLWDREEP